MAKRIILIITLLFVNNYAQNQIDSIKVDSLLNEAFELRWLNPMESIFISSKALEISKSINYGSGIAKSYSFMGVAYENLSMYDEALKHYLEGLKIADSLKLFKDIGFAYNNIANYYIHVKKFELVLEFLNKGYKIAQAINDPELLAYIYRNFSYYYREIKDYNTALNFAKKSLEIREQLNDERGIITSLREILVIYFNSKDYSNAEQTLKKLYEIIGDNKKHSLQLARIKRTEAQILQQKKKYVEAVKKFDESLEIFKSINNLEGIIRIYKLKAELYSSIGKYKEAYFHILQNNAYQDSLNEMISFQKIYLLEVQYRNKELQNKLLLASEEIKQRNIILISLFIGFMILGVSVYFTQRANSEKRKLIEKISEQNKLLEEDNKNKQKIISIIGHDIKNPLGSVYSISDFLIKNSDSLEQSELKNYLEIIYRANKNLILLLDNLILWSMNKLGNLNYSFSEVNLNDVVDKIIDLYYSNIQEKNLTVIKNIEYGKVLADENMLSAILRNLINNSIKFCDNNGEIRIRSVLENDRVLISVIDNGKGLTQDQINNIIQEDESFSSYAKKSESSTGLGLQVVKDFVKLHNGELFISSKPNKETVFSFSIKKIKSEVPHLT